jgi:hypothetical protein
MSVEGYGGFEYKNCDRLTYLSFAPHLRPSMARHNAFPFFFTTNNASDY